MGLVRALTGEAADVGSAGRLEGKCVTAAIPQQLFGGTIQEVVGYMW
jgi:hypothetical protein